MDYKAYPTRTTVRRSVTINNVSPISVTARFYEIDDPAGPLSATFLDGEKESFQVAR